MSDEITLTLEKREVVGKGVKQLRREGQLPAVIHDHGKESVLVMLPYTDGFKVYQRAGKHHPVNLKVGSKKYLALIKDADFEPRKNDLRHLVFNAIAQDQKVEAEIPVVFDGDPEAEKTGLMILRQIEAVQVEALPKDLPDEIKVDISGLAEIGDRIQVGDLTMPANVELVTEPEHPVAIVEEPRAHAAAEAEEAAEAAEGEGGETAEGEGSEAPAAEGDKPAEAAKEE